MWGDGVRKGLVMVAGSSLLPVVLLTELMVSNSSWGSIRDTGYLCLTLFIYSSFAAPALSTS